MIILDVYTSIVKDADAPLRAAALACRNAGSVRTGPRADENETARLLTATPCRNNFLHGVTHA